MIKKYGDLMSGIATAMFATIIFVASGFIKQRNNTGLGADFVPKLAAVILLVLGILLIIRGVRTSKAYGPIQKESVPAAYGVMAASFVLMLAYISLLSTVGFILTTMVYLFLQMILVSKKEQVNYIKFAAISVIASVGIYLLFLKVFSIMIPAGILG